MGFFELATQQDIPKARRGSRKSAPGASVVRAATGERNIATIVVRAAKDWSPEEKQSVIHWVCHEKYDDLFRQAGRILGNHDAARDVTQKFLLDLLSSTSDLSHFTPEKGQLWPTYIKACLKKLAVKDLVRRSKERARTAPLDESGPIVSPPYGHTTPTDSFQVAEPASPRHLNPAEKSVDHQLALAVLRACLEQLKPMQKKALYFVEFEGWNPSSLEERFGATAETWRQRLRRARENIRICVTERYRLRRAGEKAWTGR